MSERLKYAHNGVYRAENFAENLAANTLPEITLATEVCYEEWGLKLVICPGFQVQPIFTSEYTDDMKVYYFFNIIKKNGSSGHRQAEQVYLKKDGHSPRGHGIDCLELLNVKNGFLDNGALVMEYGLQVESRIFYDVFWEFCDSEPIFDCKEKKNMITFHSDLDYFSPHYVHKQIMIFHSKQFESKCKEEKGNVVQLMENDHKYLYISGFVQIAHGVQMTDLFENSITEIINLARAYSFVNVIKYCERQLIERKWSEFRIADFDMHMKHCCILNDDMRHYLVHYLKRVKSPKDVIKEEDVQKMKGETLKIFIAVFVYNKF